MDEIACFTMAEAATALRPAHAVVNGVEYGPFPDGARVFVIVYADCPDNGERAIREYIGQGGAIVHRNRQPSHEVLVVGRSPPGLVRVYDRKTGDLDCYDDCNDWLTNRVC